MKYSFLIPYYNRVRQFHNTLVSYWELYRGRDDWEVIVAEDAKNPERDGLLQLLISFRYQVNRRVSCLKDTMVENRNPARLFDIAAGEAKGEFLIITNPECYHAVDVLGGLDEEFGRDPGAYVVCGCMHVVTTARPIRRMEEFEFKEKMWYQHSQHRNRQLHFCSSLSREGWDRIGGFGGYDPRRVAKDDVWFHGKVKGAGIPIVTRDDLLVYHQQHERAA